MSIVINRLVLEANTADGPYGLDIKLSKGLFILRVENTHGKSTCINSIAYALGMEMALGQQTSKPPFPPSLLKSIQDKDGREHLVISSQVILEISNDKGKTVTLKRSILGGSGDTIIKLFESDMKSAFGDGINLFLHREGDTTRDLGFYSWFSKFVGWDLPFVPSNTGKELPLYPAILFPLFFVEQKKGWGAIQATTPFHFQISQAKKRAFEFITNLDINDIVKKKATNKQLIDQASNEWRLLYSKLQNSAIRLSGVVNGVTEQPTSKYNSYAIDILIQNEKEWISLFTALDNAKNKLNKHNKEHTPQNNQVSSLAPTIKDLTGKLLDLEARRESISGESSFIQHEITATEKRITSLTDDKRKYEDLRKIKSFKILNETPLLTNECPTCGKEYSDHSLDILCSEELMTLEESLDFIKSQINTFTSVSHSYQTQLKTKSIELNNTENEISSIEKKVIRLKRSLISENNPMNEEHLREKIRLENLVESFEEELNNLAVFRLEFDKLHTKHTELKRLRKSYPEHGFSKNDFAKLNALENKVTDYLSQFGFSSFDPNLMKISKDNYLPTREGFDLGFDTSASDGIRVIWSYLLSLFSLGNLFRTNHPGILIFDEPRQQEANKLSFAGLLKGASETSNAGQIIFATSEEEEILKDALNGCEYSLCSFTPSDGKILRKKDDGNI